MNKKDEVIINRRQAQAIFSLMFNSEIEALRIEDQYAMGEIIVAVGAEGEPGFRRWSLRQDGSSLLIA